MKYIMEQKDVRLSRTLSWLLRHSGPDEGLVFRSDGYTAIDGVAKYMKISVEKLHDIVATNAKQRFIIDNGYIKATQGHTIDFAELNLKPVKSADEIGIAVHGTRKAHLDSIMKNGLSRMNRTHIHFAKGLPGESGVISGMRQDSDVFIYLNIQKCLDDGIELFLSENYVILTKGINGFVPPEYFFKIVVKT